MATRYCPHCDQNVTPRRVIGVGTFILSLLTAFLWVLLIPFYEKRCPICKASGLPKSKKDTPKKFIDKKTITEKISTIDVPKTEELKISSQNDGATKSVADELTKLAVLRKQGLLTNKEFIQQKKKLIES